MLHACSLLADVSVIASCMSIRNGILRRVYVLIVKAN